MKRAAVGLLAGLIGLSVMGLPASAYGEDNDMDFSFNVPGGKRWGYINYAEYRGTASMATPCKVNFAYSTEGQGKIMDYFLLNNSIWSYFQYSDFKSVKQGSGNKYFHAYGAACKQYVRIGAKNKNDVPNNYTVSGYWDEETAKHAFND